MLLEKNKKKYEDKGEEVTSLEKVYMIGDTRDADIRGTIWHNRHRTDSNKIPWESILVETGEYTGKSPLRNSPIPDKIVKGVWDAVAWAWLDEEGKKAAKAKKSFP